MANATARRLNELIALNLEELEQILLFNEAHGVEVFRIGSSLVPLASHPVNRVRWWKTFERDFAALGRIASRSNQRLSMHPSPAGASLASARETVRAAAIAELTYGTRVLDLLGQGPDARIVVHVGGAAPDRTTALEAAHRFLDAMPVDARRRLAIENDDRIWSAREVLPLARAHGLPFLADTLHNQVLPSDPPVPLGELLPMAAASWLELHLRPKFHLASQKEAAKPGAHADFVTFADWISFREGLTVSADAMLEAKAKDLALFALREKQGAEMELGGPGAVEPGLPD